VQKPLKQRLIKTVAINAADAEYDQMIAAYPLTERELEVLQLIVEGCSGDRRKAIHHSWDS